MKLKHIPAAYHVTIKGLVRDNAGRLLFVRERGGALEHGEGLNEALRREFREEVQSEIEILPTTPVIIPTWHNKFDDPVLIIAFEVTLLGNPRVSEEAEELAYLHPQDIAPNQLDSTLINKLSVLICDTNQ